MKRHIILLLLSIFQFPIFANIRLPKLISDGVILQRDAKVNVWGWADAGEKISIRIDGKKYATVADAQGNWKVLLQAHKAGGSYTMTLTGNNRLEVKNILFGDVWLCSGQSNMELPMRRVLPLYKEEIAQANNPNIRTFIVPQKYNFKAPETDYSGGAWQSVTPQTILNHSAVAYFFASEIYSRTHIPVGIINASLGGSPIQAWMSEEALKAFPDYLSEAYKWRSDELIKQTESTENKAVNAWYAEANRTDKGHEFPLWSTENLNDSAWQTISLPGYWNDLFPNIKNGVVWLRREFTLSSQEAGKAAFLNCGRIVDADSVFINGRCVGNVTYQYPPRWYNVPENLLKEGRNSIVVRVVSNSGKGGFVPDKPYELTIGTAKIDLKGVWKIKQGCPMSPTPSTTFVRWKPMGLYNAMIAPQNQFTHKGIVWYQGEANTGKPDEYAQLLPAMIADWRTHFGQPNLPFVYAQLPNFMEPKAQPAESNWAQLRASQQKTLRVKNTGMAVTIDAGEWNDIHPLNKKTVGVRLARQAEKIAYHAKIDASAPVAVSVLRKGNQLEISFGTNKQALKTNDGKVPAEFALAGEDGKYHWAKAEIRERKIVVSSDEVANPVSVRYAWADNPDKANLIDENGNWVSPFELKLGK